MRLALCGISETGPTTDSHAELNLVIQSISRVYVSLMALRYISHIAWGVGIWVLVDSSSFFPSDTVTLLREVWVMFKLCMGESGTHI